MVACARLSFRNTYDILTTANCSARDREGEGEQGKREELKDIGLMFKELYSLVAEQENITK